MFFTCMATTILLKEVTYTAHFFLPLKANSRVDTYGFCLTVQLQAYAFQQYTAGLDQGINLFWLTNA